MSSVAPSILTSNAPRKRNPVIQIALQGGEQRRSGPQYALRGGALVHGDVKARVSEINLVYLGVWETIRIAVPTPYFNDSVDVHSQRREPFCSVYVGALVCSVRDSSATTSVRLRRRLEEHFVQADRQTNDRVC